MVEAPITLRRSRAAAAAFMLATFSFGASSVALLADVKPCMVRILTPLAAGRAFLSIVPIPTDRCFSGGEVILFHALVVAVAVDTKAKLPAALIAATIASHSRSFSHPLEYSSQCNGSGISVSG